MDDEVKKEEEERDFAKRKEELEKRDKDKTDKNRLKREKARLRKEKAEKAKKAAKGGEPSEREGTPTAENTAKRKLVPNSNGLKADKEGEGETDEHEGGEVKNADEVGLVIEDDD